MTILGELYKQNAGAWIELFTIDATAQGGGLYHFHAGTNGLRQPVVWQGTTFVPFPVQASGFEVSSQKLPRPRLAIANVNGTISALLQEVDLLGAKVIRRRTMVKYLDAVNFPVAQQSTPGVLTFARSTTATYYGTDGLLKSAAVDAARIDCEPGTGVVRGLLVEEQRTNLLPNSTCSDGTVGIVGSGGALPTGWSVPAALGLTVEVLATNIDPVLGGCRVRVYGTTTASGTFRIRISQTYVATVGQTYVSSCFARIVSGTSPSQLGIQAVNSTSLGNTTSGKINTAPSLSAARLLGTPYTIAYAGVQQQWFELRFTAANATAYDFTVEITGGQIENNSTASSYIPTTTTAVTRAADNETSTSLSAIGYSATAGGLTVTARAPASLAQAATLLSYNDNSTNNVIRFRMEAGGALKAEVIAGGVTQASLALGTLTAGTQFRAALSYAANDIRGCLNGGAVQSDTSASIPTVDRTMIGRGASGEWLNSTISRHRYWSRALTSTELQTVTSGGAISDLPALDMDTSTGALAVYTLAPFNPTADPNSHLDDETWYIAQKTTENQAIIEFELGSPIDLEGVTIPRRQIVANVCGWRYRGDGCGYAGPPVADVNDQPTSSALLDRCSKRLSGCKLRFGSNAELPWGAFPAAGLIRR